jgi:hypothetical protein
MTSGLFTERLDSTEAAIYAIQSGEAERLFAETHVAEYVVGLTIASDLSRRAEHDMPYGISKGQRLEENILSAAILLGHIDPYLSSQQLADLEPGLRAGFAYPMKNFVEPKPRQGTVTHTGDYL